MEAGTLEQVFEREVNDVLPKDYTNMWEVIRITKDTAMNNPEMAEIFGQYDRQSRITPAHYLAYSRILNWIYTGDLTIVTIPFGHEPLPDSEIEDNDAMLKDLPYGITGTFGGGLADSDGKVEWSVPLNLNMIVDGVLYESNLLPDSYPPHARLEVGYTTYMTSYWHLLQTGVLARWCYGSKSIRLIHYTGKLAAELVNFDID